MHKIERIKRLRSVRRLTLLSAALILLAACGGATAPTAGRAATTANVSATEFSFAPQNITARLGQPITIVLKNDGQLEHDWTVMQLEAEDVRTSPEAEGGGHAAGGLNTATMPEVHVAAGVGQTASLTFTPKEAGSYEFICTVAGHKEAGMRGTLRVEQ